MKIRIGERADVSASMFLLIPDILLFNLYGE